MKAGSKDACDDDPALLGHIETWFNFTLVPDVGSPTCLQAPFNFRIIENKNIIL